MAHQTIILTSGVYFKKAYRGFSWTMLFFGAFPAAFRSDWKTFWLVVLADTFTFGFAGMIYSFFYNKNHFNKLLDSGYKVIKFEDEFQEAELCEWLGRVSIPTTQKV